MELLVKTLFDSDRISEIKREWNELVNKYGQNPFLLSGFIRQFMEFSRERGWRPLILTFSVRKELIGIAPLRVKRLFGIKIVKFLIRNWFSPDFVIKDGYRELCIQQILKLLFNEFKFQFAELVFPHNSKNLDSLEKNCRKLALFHSIRSLSSQWSDMWHSIIPVNSTWEEFIKSNRHLKRRLRKIEKGFNKLGIWRIKVFENGEINELVLNSILDIENRSWKHKWRMEKRLARDHDLFMVLNGAMETSGLDKDFKWYVWFLEVKGLDIAYSLILVYKQTAYIVKTSYDEKYRKYYPGIFVNNAAIQAIFQTENIKTIDWLTKLEFHRNWTSVSLPRVKVLVSRKTLPILLGYTYTSNFTRGILSTIPLTGEKLERRDLHFL